ncbi:hypothetical protein ACSI5F_03815 [Ralstonia pseudosolanacearum]|uniref:hypothetical protein n=1 Tax=Ralstonia pseudosolanacearum TaxID=1310165 RepID=UPI003EE03EAD
MKRLYARLVLWLIRPALREFASEGLIVIPPSTASISVEFRGAGGAGEGVISLRSSEAAGMHQL